MKQFTELAGVDVILVHRMFKNDVPVREYVLMTDPILKDVEPSVSAVATAITHDFEGIGPTLGLVMLNLRSLPYFVGLKKPCAEFRNVDSGT